MVSIEKTIERREGNISKVRLGDPPPRRGGGEGTLLGFGENLLKFSLRCAGGGRGERVVDRSIDQALPFRPKTHQFPRPRSCEAKTIAGYYYHI